MTVYTIVTAAHDLTPWVQSRLANFQIISYHLKIETGFKYKNLTHNDKQPID